MNDIALSGKPGTNPRPNRHPVDQLGDIRQTIKHLQDREAELKAEISALMGAGDTLGGAEYLAVQSLQNRKGGLDEKKLAARLDDLAGYRKPDSSFIVLKVEPRVRGDQ